MAASRRSVDRRVRPGGNIELRGRRRTFPRATKRGGSNQLVMTSLLETLRSLEVELHHPGVRCNRGRLEQLLTPDFYEVGRSGRQYSRSTVIEFLLNETSPTNVQSDDFNAVKLADNVALLTYRSAHIEANGQLRNHTLRASIWVNLDGRWQVRYHQGTPAAVAW